MIVLHKRIHYHGCHRTEEIEQTSVEDFVKHNLLHEDDRGHIETRLNALTLLVGKLIDREVKRGSMDVEQFKDLFEHSLPEITGFAAEMDWSK